jgi:GT2 family glycosyltransferase
MLSLVIPVRDGEAHLPALLASLASQGFHGDWEVIVADNGSTDRSLAVVESFAARLPTVQVVDASQRAGGAFARNVGAAAARGDLLLFVDQDDVVDQHYVQHMHAALQKHPIVAASMEYSSLNPGWVGESRTDGQVDGLAVFYGFLPAAAGTSLGIRRSLFVSLVGFDSGMGLADDVDLCWRAQLAGEALAFVPDAVLHYRYRTDLSAIFRQAFHYATHVPGLYDRYRAHGMCRRPLLTGLHVHLYPFVRLVTARDRAGLAVAVRLLGREAGLLLGMARSGTLYF